MSNTNRREMERVESDGGERDRDGERDRVMERDEREQKAQQRSLPWLARPTKPVGLLSTKGPYVLRSVWASASFGLTCVALLVRPDAVAGLEGAGAAKVLESTTKH